MKNILIALIALSSSQAHAFLSKEQGASDEVTDAGAFAYHMDSVKVGQGSYLLPPTSQVASATIRIDQATNEIQLVMERKYNCPVAAICTLQMPAPVAIVLPIKFMGSPFCGGSMLVAEGVLPSTNGGNFINIKILDDNGNHCESNADDVTFNKRIQVSITESASGSNARIISQMSGFSEQL